MTVTGSRATVTLVAACTLLGLAAGWWLRPAAHPLPADHSGDADLAAQVRELTDGRPASVVTGVVRDGEITLTAIGAPLDGEFEIGSITKPITGMLYHDAIARGEVEATTTLGEVFDLGDAPAADVTLEELAQHTSGLPRVASTLPGHVVNVWRTLRAQDPYRETVDDLLDRLREVELSGRGTASYSNFGFALLGHALAERAGLPYDRLVAERFAEPLGLSSLAVALEESGLTERAVTGRDQTGRVQQPWTGLAMAPAGTIRADVADMARLIAMTLAGEAPGMAALDPTTDFEPDRIGAGWLTREVDGRSVTWHNGGTGGFRTWLGLDREADVGVVVMAATSESMDDVGWRLLADSLEETAR